MREADSYGAYDPALVNRAERLEVISRACVLYYSHGRGCLLRLRDGFAGDEDRYSSVDDIKEALGEEPDAAALVASIIWAVGTYDPTTQAVVVQSIDDVIRVLIVRADDAEDVGGIEFSATPTQQVGCSVGAYSFSAKSNVPVSNLVTGTPLNLADTVTGSRSGVKTRATTETMPASGDEVL